MSKYDEFIRQVESESQAEGPKAVAELKAFRDYYRAALGEVENLSSTTYPARCWRSK